MGDGELGDLPFAAEYRRRGWWRDRTLVDDFLDASAERLDRAAVVTYRSGRAEPETVTYRQLRRYVDRFAEFTFSDGTVDLGCTGEQLATRLVEPGASIKEFMVEFVASDHAPFDPRVVSVVAFVVKP